MSEREEIHNAYRAWSAYDPDRCRLDPDGPAVRAYPPLGTWHDALNRGETFVALTDSIKSHAGSWSMEWWDGEEWAYRATVDTFEGNSRTRPTVALLIAYGEFICARFAEWEDDY